MAKGGTIPDRTRDGLDHDRAPRQGPQPVRAPLPARPMDPEPTFGGEYLDASKDNQESWSPDQEAGPPNDLPPVEAYGDTA